MIATAHDMPPKWLFILAAAGGAMSAYYWTWQVVKYFVN